MSILDVLADLALSHLPRERAREVVEKWRAANPQIVATWEGNAKPSKCCPGEGLVPLHGSNSKICTGCKSEIPWPLEPGQVPTFTKAIKP